MALSPEIFDGLNPPQRQAVTHGDGPLLILAGAGSGKTRVITCRIAHLLSRGVSPWNILAVTFTNKAAAEMRQRVDALAGSASRGTWISTFHAFGAQFMRVEAKALGLDPNFTIYDSDDQAQVVKECLRELNLDEKEYKPNLVIGVIGRAKDELLDADSYNIHNIARDDPFHQMAGAVYARYQKKLAKANALDFGDLIMRPVMGLRDNEALRAKYQARFKHILVDEYQDTNHAQYLLAKYMIPAPKNLCVVGDDDQCLPPDARVMTPRGPKKIADVLEGEEVLAGTGWGGVASMKVEKVMAKPYAGNLLRIRMKSGKVLSCTPNHICFARLSPQPGLYYVYLMYKKGLGYRVGVTGGFRSRVKGEWANGLMIRANQEVADALWILRSCRDAAEARYYEQYYSVTYGLPTWMFHVRGRRMAVDQSWIDRLYSEVDTEEAATRLMADLRLNKRYPHHRPMVVIRGQTHRKLVWFTVFGDNRSYDGRPWHDHRVQLVTSDPSIRPAAEARFPVHAGQRGTWRIETARKDYDEGLLLARNIGELDGLDIVSRAKLSATEPFFFMPASHLRVGMVVPGTDGKGVMEDEIVAVDSVPYKGMVYDLSVPHVRNFAAEGIFVHNSIYSWRGADIRNIMEFERDYPGAVVVKLEQNYRSTQEILTAAHSVIKRNRFRKEKKLWTDKRGGAPVRFVEFADELEEARFVASETTAGVRAGTLTPKDVAIFYRTNAQSRVLEDSFRRENIPYQLIGSQRFYERMEVKDVLAYLRVALNPADAVSVKRIINVPARGLGKATIQLLDDHANATGLTLLDAVGQAPRIPLLTPAARGNLMKFMDVLRPLQAQAEALPAAQMVQLVLESTGYWQFWQEQTSSDPEAAARLDNLQELVNAAKEFDEAEDKGAGPDAVGEAKSVRAFLERVSLSSGLDAAKDGSGAVTLMTVHLAKGLEFPSVYVTGLEEGLFPIGESAFDEKELEEERRLAYVAITRAREKLVLTAAASRKIYGRSHWNVPSRFVAEAGLRPEAPPAADPASFGGWGGRRAEPKPTRPPETTGSIASFDPDEAEAPVNAPPGSPRPLKVGQRVRHPMFGPGKILNKTGTGENVKVTVLFDAGPRKDILARYANFEVL